MKKKFKLLATLGCLMGLCVGLAACGDDLTAPERNAGKGYTVSVTYDPSGGKIDNAANTTITDMYNPSKYEKDGDGTVHIKLTAPENTVRGETEKGEPQYKPMPSGQYFLVGWYQNRTVRKVNGHPVDDYGNVLFEGTDGVFIRVMYDSNGLPIESIRTRTDKDTGTLYDSDGYILVETPDGKFYRVGKKDEDGKVLDGVFDSEGLPMTVTPAYDYSDLWDFENDTLDYNKAEDGKKKSLTLYAGWVKYFEFNYYYRFEDETNEDWKAYNGNYTFNKLFVDENQTGKDTVYLPKMENGAMQYELDYQYQNTNGTFSFPRIENSTFKAAYKDDQCQTQIVGSWKHEGEVIEENCTAKDRVQNVYIVLERGERFEISTAEQFVKHAKADGYYEIMNDLDFSYQEEEDGQMVTKYYAWPSNLMSGTFTGKIYNPNGEKVTFSNVQATYSEGGSEGGLFGRIGSGATIKDVASENVTFSIDAVSTKATEASFGLFAGFIEDDATVDVAKVVGTMKLGNIKFSNSTDYELNLLANGNRSGIDEFDIDLQLVGEYKKDINEDGDPAWVYGYQVDPENPESVKVDGNGNVTLVFGRDSYKRENYQPSYNIQINGGN